MYVVFDKNEKILEKYNGMWQKVRNAVYNEKKKKKTKIKVYNKKNKHGFPW